MSKSKIPDKITNLSSKEEIASFFGQLFKLDAKQQQCLINHDISGDIIGDINDKEFREIGIKLGPSKLINKYLNDNKPDFK